MPEILTPLCPFCNEPPIVVMGGGTQAFCGNGDGCALLIWDPTLSLDANLMNARGIDWEPTAAEPPPDAGEQD